MPSRRFGLRSGAKYRAIDDFSGTGINGALGALETIVPTDIDGIVPNVRAHTDAFVLPPSSRSTSSPFRHLRRHADVEGDKIVGRLLDLTNAYKHIAVKSSHHSFLGGLGLVPARAEAGALPAAGFALRGLCVSAGVQFGGHTSTCTFDGLAADWLHQLLRRLPSC